MYLNIIQLRSLYNYPSKAVYLLKYAVHSGLQIFLDGMLYYQVKSLALLVFMPAVNPGRIGISRFFPCITEPKQACYISRSDAFFCSFCLSIKENPG